MALPPRRHSKQRGRKRRTHWKFRLANLTKCPQCKQLKPSHQICPFCGFYKDRVVVKIKTKKAAREFLQKANSSLPGVMELELEGIYPAGIFVLAKTGVAAKKRYALIDDSGRMTIRGFEKVRRDWAPIARDTQEGVLKAILKDRSPEKALGIVRKTIKRLKR